MASEGDVLEANLVIVEPVNEGGRPTKFTDTVAFAEQLSDYFNGCNNRGELPTITGLALYLGTDRKTLYNYKSKDGFSPLIKAALNRCEASIEQLAMQGKINPTMAIFSLKNNYGWVDKTEVDNKHEVVQPILGGAAKQIEDTDEPIQD